MESAPAVGPHKSVRGEKWRSTERQSAALKRAKRIAQAFRLGYRDDRMREP
jgi:hypothetical protein